MTFQYKVLSDNVTALPVSGGIVNTYATRMVSASSSHNATLAQVTPGSTTFYAPKCAPLPSPCQSINRSFVFLPCAWRQPTQG